MDTVVQLFWLGLAIMLLILFVQWAISLVVLGLGLIGGLLADVYKKLK